MEAYYSHKRTFIAEYNNKEYDSIDEVYAALLETARLDGYTEYDEKLHRDLSGKELKDRKILCITSASLIFQEFSDGVWYRKVRYTYSNGAKAIRFFG